ncbi:MAG: Re/Si-specific NAD(P)(+) transhydrogenase subunit alpha [Chromatiales bacterium]|jgi:NAD(P) transhydrogenase subunit alpha
MRIGVPKETAVGETRVALTPDVAKRLIGKGFEVLLERSAGAAAHFPDEDYEASGAVLGDAAEALSADLVVKIRRPSGDEIEGMREGAVLIGFTELCEDDGTLAALHRRGVSMLAMERMPRISRAQAMDALSSQSNIGGYRAVIEAAAHYGRFFPVMMTPAGSAKPARVLVIGAGVAGLQAIATARRLGAEVWAYDVRPETAEQIRSLGAKPVELDLGESGAGEGGYARELSEEARQRQQELLSEELAKAHVIITTALIPCRPAPELISEEVVRRMREGSVIVDLAAANGGNCALTEKDEVVVRHGVTIIGHTNFPAMVPSDASTFYAGNIRNLLEIMVDASGEAPALKDLDEDEITKAMRVRPES